MSLRNLIHAPQLLVLPGVYDGLSARIARKAGFSALCAGGFSATGSLRGQPDLGQLGLRDFADHYARVVAASGLPVLVDADTGFGGIHQIRDCVRLFERAGVAGMFFEDQTFPKRCGYLPGKSLEATPTMVSKIRAALDARTDPSFVIVARTDALGVDGEDAAIARAAAYAEAGADMTFVQGADTPALLARICRQVPRPQLANLSTASGEAPMSLAEIAGAGAAAVILPNTALMAAAAAVQQVMQALAAGQVAGAQAPAVMPISDYNELVGLADFYADEVRFA